MTLALASTTMSPPTSVRNCRTVEAGSAVASRALLQSSAVIVWEKTTFSASFSHRENSRSRGSASSSSATAGQ